MLLSFRLKPCHYFILEHFLLEKHDVGALEDVERYVVVVEVFGAEEAFLVAAKDVLSLLADEAGSALKEVKLAEDWLVLAVCEFCDVLESNQHVLPHYRLLSQRYFGLRAGYCLHRLCCKLKDY